MTDEGGAGEGQAVPTGESWPDRLDSWKEIAAYLGRGVSTLQRWEQDEGLPIHRLPHAKKGSVFAYRRELDAWLSQRTRSGPPSATDARRVSPTDSGSPVTTELDSATLAALPATAAPSDAVGASPRGWRFTAIAAGLLLAAIGTAAWLHNTSGIPAAPSSTGGQRSTATSDPARRVGDSPFTDAALVPRILADAPDGELSPSLSRDGTQIVYSWEHANDGIGLYVKPVAGGTPRKLAIGPGLRFEESAHPTWSPRGDLIAFLAYEAPQIYALHVVSPNGGVARRLTSMAGIGLCWYPDGHSIGFVDRLSTGDPFSVFVLSLDTGQRRRVTTPPSGVFGDTHCAFSGDGQQLAVVRYDTRQVSDLFVIEGASAHAGNPPMSASRSVAAAWPISMRDESARTRRLTHDLPGLDGIVWTPDSAALIAGSHRGLWRVAANGSSSPPALLIAADGDTGSPSVAHAAHDGRTRLVYHYARRNADLRWWRADAAGDDRRRGAGPLLAGSPQCDDEPALSPDGRQVAFTSNRSGTTEIWIAPADGAHPRQLTSHGPIVMTPQWSPDGRRLVFVRQVNGDRDIYVIDADGGRSTRLTWEPSQEENPTWSRDGDWIYFRSDRGGSGQIWKTRTHGGEPAKRVTTGAASQAFESPDGALLYFVRGTDAPGLWVMLVDGGPEILLLPEVRERLWGVADKGIAFVDRSNLRAPEGLPIRFYDFASRSTTTRAMIPMSPEVTTGFAIARDGRSALWTTVSPTQHDLMLLDLPPSGASARTTEPATR